MNDEYFERTLDQVILHLILKQSRTWPSIKKKKKNDIVVHNYKVKSIKSPFHSKVIGKVNIGAKHFPVYQIESSSI